MELVTRLDLNTIFIPGERWECNRFLAMGCKARCQVYPLRHRGVAGIVVSNTTEPHFIAQMEAAFNV